MTTHTPGPWCVVNTYNVVAPNYSWKGAHVAECKGYTFDNKVSDPRRAAADAALIAAAPDLLAALREIVCDLDLPADWPDNAVVSIRVDRLTQFVCNLRDIRCGLAAIAKAEGRAP